MQRSPKYHPEPPCWATRFLRWYCHPDLLDEVEGDLYELFRRRVEMKGLWKAKVLYWLNVLMFLHPDYIRRKREKNYTLNHTAMFKNYLKITLRSLLRRKVYSGINILGLAIGIACCLLIFQYVVFEYSFDTFHKNAPTIYRVNSTTIRAGGAPNTESTSGWAMGPALAQEVPEVERFVRLHPEYDNAIITNPTQPDKAFEEEWVYYADSTFFQMFSYPMVSGNPNQALSPGTVMLSESIAKKYFGEEDPMGQTLDVRGWISGSFRVNGVFQDIPAHSHLRFDVLLPMADLLEKSQFNNPETGWGWTNFITYVQLHEQADVAAARQKSTNIFLKNQEEDFKPTNTTGHLSFQPLLDIHLNEDISAPKAVMGSYRAVYFFAIIGLVTLLIAFINYINLTTARALDRAREVGVRKVVGARRRQLITQFLSESALTIFLAFILAIVMSNAFSPLINNWAGVTLSDTLWTNPSFWIAFVALFCISTLIAGLYPALMLSSFKPVTVLKGKGSRSATSIWLRQGLVVFQFATSIALLTGTFIVQHQLHYILNMDLGISLEQIMTVPAPRVLPGNADRAAIETFMQELHQLPAVRQTATSGALPGKGFSFTTDNIRKAEADPSSDIPGSVTNIDTAFTRLYDLALVAGDGSKGISLPTPEDKSWYVLANETAIHALGFDTPEDALLQDVLIAGNNGRIVGVLKDFHWSSAHQEREVAFFRLRQANPQISIKVNTENLPQTIADIEKTYKQLFPGNPFLYAFADETFEAQYRNDQRFAKLFNLFAALAIFIACLGLFGLATFTAQQRTKEIGIRKVLGATLTNVVLLLSKDFLKLVMIGFLAAIPLAWYTMNRWLEDFAYHITISAGVFLLAGLAAVLIAIATVSWQSLKAALANPVDSLRDE